MVVSTTGTSIGDYLDWVARELSEKEYGEVAIEFIVKRGQVTDVRKRSVDADHFPLQPLER
jgi:hypothetical protein